MEYKFLEDKNTMVITTKAIINGQNDILLVSHDADDGIWEFLDGEEVVEENARIVSIAEMVKIDGSINKVYDLPVGWIAYRENKTTEWLRTLYSEI